MSAAMFKFLLNSTGFYSLRVGLSEEFHSPIPFVGNQSLQDDWDDFMWSLTGFSPTWVPRALLIATASTPAGVALGAPLIGVLLTGEIVAGRHEKSEVAFGESLYAATFDDSNRLRMHNIGSSTLI